MQPLIGITTSFTDDEIYLMMHRSYPVAIAQAGAVPVMLPATADPALITRYAQMIDGLLLPGGDDMDPAHFGEVQSWKCGNICPDRDAFELALCRQVLRLKKPILGICRGLQALNVALGGTLYQDLASECPESFAHQQKQKPCYPSHRVSLMEDSLLADVLGAEEVMVNSHHHQAVKRLGDGLRASATAPDGVIEAAEHTSLPFCLGVQWHPERLWDQPSTQVQARLFTAFARACCR